MYSYIVEEIVRGKCMTEDKRQLSGQFEELVLRAVISLKGDAYGVSIRRAVAEATKKDTTIGAVYTTLERLEEKGFLRSWQGEATAERGGRAKRYFDVTGAGVQALADAQWARDLLSGKPRLEGGVA